VKLIASLCKFAGVVLIGFAVTACRNPAENEIGISKEQGSVLLAIAGTKAAELGFKLEELETRVRRVDEKALDVDVGYYTEITRQKLRGAVKKEKELFEVDFYPKATPNGYTIRGGGLSIYLNKEGRFIAFEAMR
jgi:hypothetical protein